MSRLITRTPGERAARALVIGLLGRMRDGAVILHDGGRRFLCGRPVAGERIPEVEVVSPETWRAIATEGSAGLGRSWSSGWWACDLDDLTAFLRVIVRNLDLVERTSTAASRLAAPLHPLHLLRPSSRSGRDGRDGGGNGGGGEGDGGEGDDGRETGEGAPRLLEDPRLAGMLDDTGACAAALFASAATSLHDAQTARIDRLCRLLRLSPADRLLGVGTGLGAVAVHAARTYGCEVTITAPSRAWRDEAAARVEAAGADDLVTVVGDDVGSLSGTYDKVVAVEAIHRLDWRAHEGFLASCADRLAPGGLLAVQEVVVADQRYERAKRSEDFVTRHVLPGSRLPSVTSLVEAATRASDLRLVALDDVGAHYAETLRRWRANLVERRGALDELGVDEGTRRLLEFFLAYREAGFAERRISAVQCCFAGARWRPANLDLPAR